MCGMCGICDMITMTMLLSYHSAVAMKMFQPLSGVTYVCICGDMVAMTMF